MVIFSDTDESSVDGQDGDIVVAADGCGDHVHDVFPHAPRTYPRGSCPFVMEDCADDCISGSCTHDEGSNLGIGGPMIHDNVAQLI